MRLSLVLAFLAAMATPHSASPQKSDGPQALSPVAGGAVAANGPQHVQVGSAPMPMELGWSEFEINHHIERGERFFGLARARTLPVTFADQPGPAEILVRRR